MKGWATWLSALVLAMLLPPLGVWLARRRGPGLAISLLGCVAAAGLFAAMAVAGLALWGLMVAHAVIVVVAFGIRRRADWELR